jgi:hypothetical protein
MYSVPPIKPSQIAHGKAQAIFSATRITALLARGFLLISLTLALLAFPIDLSRGFNISCGTGRSLG